MAGWKERGNLFVVYHSRFTWCLSKAYTYIYTCYVNINTYIYIYTYICIYFCSWSHSPGHPPCWSCFSAQPPKCHPRKLSSAWKQRSHAADLDPSINGWLWNMADNGRGATCFLPTFLYLAPIYIYICRAGPRLSWIFRTMMRSYTSNFIYIYTYVYIYSYKHISRILSLCPSAPTSTQTSPT